MYLKPGYTKEWTRAIWKWGRINGLTTKKWNSRMEIYTWSLCRTWRWCWAMVNF